MDLLLWRIAILSCVVGGQISLYHMHICDKCETLILLMVSALIMGVIWIPNAYA